MMLIVQSADLVDESLENTGVRLPNFRKRTHCNRNSLGGFWVGHGFSMTFRRELVKSIPWRDRPKEYNGRSLTHDRWICVLANALGDVLLLPDTVALYRRHSDAITGGYQKTKLADQLSLALSTPSFDVISNLFHSACGLRAFLRAASSPSLLGPVAPPIAKICASRS